MAAPELENLSIQESKPKLENVEPPKNNKIEILVRAAGDAPILKVKKWCSDPQRTVANVIMFIKKCLKMDDSESLFLYVNQCFAPSPDQIIQNLYDCFGTDGKLIFYYCKTQAWG